MESEHWIGKIAQKAYIEKDGKILLSRFPSDTVWDMPGGRIHKGEQPLEGLAREILEELGVEVVIGEPFFAEMTKAESTGEERYFVGFKAKLKDPAQPFVFQKEEVAEVCWVGADEVETRPLFDVCRRGLQAYFAKQ
jgi:8-oxo-dGTP pyrophosphatase MutT (NUDIX family)